LPAHPPTNVNLYTNPIPFAQFDWSQSKRTPDFLPPAQPYGITFYGTVTAAPFAQLDWSQTKRTPDFLPSSQPYNINIFSEVPFSQLDWSKVRRAPAFLPDAQFYNANLYGVITAAPFAQYDWSTPRRTPDVLPPAHLPTNINLYTNPIPFAQYSWTPTFNIPGLPPQRLPYNINLYTAAGTEVLRAPVLGSQKAPATAFQSKYLGTPVTLLVDLTAAPFAQLDWPSTKRTPDVLVPTPHYNTNIFSEVPFYKSDWSTAAIARLTAPVPASYNTGLYATVPAPFIPIDWSKPFRASPATAATPPLNINLFTNPIPFSQTDWSAASRQKPSAGVTQPLNINLYGVVVVAPFSQLNWPSPRRVASAPVDLSRILNLNIYTNPIPFAQYSWTAPSAHVNAPYFVIQDFMLLVSVSPASETPHIVKFIGNVGHLMLR
jgi:hypothetical protein